MANNDTGFINQVTVAVNAWWQDVNNKVFRGANPVFGLTAGAVNAQTLTLPIPSLYTLAAPGDSFTFEAGLTNAGAMTLSVQGTGALPVEIAGNPLVGGEVIAGELYTVVCKGGTSWQIMNSGGGGGVSAGAIQDQSFTAFTTTGTAPDYILTPAPAVSWTANQTRLTATFHAAGTTGMNTINVGGEGVVDLMQYDATGAKTAAVITAGMKTDLIWDGTDMLVLDPLTPAASSGLLVTGMGMDWWGDAAPTGWVYSVGTIGSAASGATTRANADTAALYALFWDNYSNTICPVSTGRGASAAADFAANKTLTLVDKRGRVSVGRDNMGGSTAGRITNAGAGIVGTTLGASGGTQTHQLTVAELASHQHSTNSASPLSNGISGDPGGAEATTTNSSGTGGDQPHQNTQPSIVCNYILKL